MITGELDAGSAQRGVRCGLITLARKQAVSEDESWQVGGSMMFCAGLARPQVARWMAHSTASVESKRMHMQWVHTCGPSCSAACCASCAYASSESSAAATS